MNDFSPNPAGLPRPQKIAVTALALIAVLIVIFWIWQMEAQINRPFSSGPEETAVTAATSTDVSSILKGRDTDSDGISDYDEIYVHHTSPYLEDTDSDGLTDLAELNRGSDPNCPEGRNCSEQAATSSEAAYPAATGTSSAATTTESAAMQQALSGQIDAPALRQLLINGGAVKEDLDKMTDSDLMKSYQEILNKQSQATAAQ